MTLSVWDKEGKKRRFASGDINLKFDIGESPLLPLLPYKKGNVIPKESTANKSQTILKYQLKVDE
jgi:hypothetical protein